MPSSDGDPRATLARSRHLLEPAALDEIARFVESRRNTDGGFRGRDTNSDLYYTYFAMECLHALGKRSLTPSTEAYILRYQDGHGLDFVHYCCLAHCLAHVAENGGRRPAIKSVLSKLETYRTPDGGYAEKAGTDHGTAYACYLAWLAYSRWNHPLPDPGEVVRRIATLKAADGGYANAYGSQTGLVTASAAAGILLHTLGLTGLTGTGLTGTDPEPEPRLREWLLAHAAEEGGLRAAAGSPVADLLSTATGLFALQTLGGSISRIGPACAEFVQSLWQNDGGFSSQPLDMTADCEYTYYGLLALGCLEAYV